MREKPKLCLIWTGGTIGMEQKDGTTQPPREINKSDILNFAPDLKDTADFDFVKLMQKDSSNVNPEDWVRMANAIYKRIYKGYSGFVIAHGTDTMHFSSTALAFSFGQNLHIPIVFTGAQTTPAIKHGDASTNLSRAFKVVLADLAEVVIFFNDSIFRGCRVEKKDEVRFDAFISPSYFPIGYIVDKVTLDSKSNYDSRKKKKPIDYKPLFEKGIIQVTLTPGLEPKLFFPLIENDTCQGIILQAFGAGNVPHKGNYSILTLIKRAVKLNKPVILSSQFSGHSTLNTDYEAGKAAIEAGAIPVGAMTSTAINVKFRWVLAQVLKDIRDGKCRKSDKMDRVELMMNSSYVKEMEEET